MWFSVKLCCGFVLILMTIKHNGKCEKIPYHIGDAVVMVDADTLSAVQPYYKLIQSGLTSRRHPLPDEVKNSPQDAFGTSEQTSQNQKTSLPFAVNDESLLKIKIIPGPTSPGSLDEKSVPDIDADDPDKEDSLVKRFRSEIIIAKDEESEVHRVLQENFDDLEKPPEVISVKREHIVDQRRKPLDADSKVASIQSYENINPSNLVEKNIELETKEGDSDLTGSDTEIKSLASADKKSERINLENETTPVVESQSQEEDSSTTDTPYQDILNGNRNIIANVNDTLSDTNGNTDNSNKYSETDDDKAATFNLEEDSKQTLSDFVSSLTKLLRDDFDKRYGNLPNSDKKKSPSGEQFPIVQQESYAPTVSISHVQPIESITHGHLSSQFVSQLHQSSQSVQHEHPSSQHVPQTYPSSQPSFQTYPSSQTISQGYPSSHQEHHSSQPVSQGFHSQTVIQEHPSSQPSSQGFPSQPVSQGYPTQHVSQGSPSTQGFPSQHVSQGFPSQPVSQGHPSQPISQGYPSQPSQGFPSSKPISQGYPSQPASQVFPSSQGQPPQPVSQGYPSQPVSQGYPSFQPVSQSYPTSHTDNKKQKYPSNLSDFLKIIEKLTEKIEKGSTNRRPNRNKNKNKNKNKNNNRNQNKNQNQNKNKNQNQNKNKNKGPNRIPYGKYKRTFERVVGRMLDELESESENEDKKTYPYLMFTLNEIKSRSTSEEDSNFNTEDEETGQDSSESGQEDTEEIINDFRLKDGQNKDSDQDEDIVISNNNIKDQLTKKYKEIIKDIANIIATSIIDIASISKTQQENNEAPPSGNIVIKVLNQLKKKYPDGIFTIDKKMQGNDSAQQSEIKETQNDSQNRFSYGPLVDRLTEQISKKPIFTGIGNIDARNKGNFKSFSDLHARHATGSVEVYGNGRKYHKVIIKEENGETKLIHDTFTKPNQSEMRNHVSPSQTVRNNDNEQNETPLFMREEETDTGTDQVAAELSIETQDEDAYYHGDMEGGSERGAALKTIIVRGRRISMNESFACGLPQTRRIIGGKITDIKQHPWMVQLLFKKTKTPFCGGTIINNKYILTAAHCLNFITADKVLVRVEHTRPGRKTEGRTVEPKKFIVHPRYKDSVIEKYDIGLIKLKESLLYSDKALPICLPPSAESDVNGEKGIITGWGIFEEGSRSPSNVLREAFVKIFDEIVCKKKSSYKDWELNESVVCASETQIDSCQGDSGGPLNYVLKEYGVFTQAGITSWGLGCARKKYPGVYTEVSYYYDWIMQHTTDAVWSCYAAWNSNCKTHRRVQPIQF